jgi:hypothetical protein
MYMETNSQRLTQVGILRALTWPGFFLSTFLGSRVTQPAVKQLVPRSIMQGKAIGNSGEHPQGSWNKYTKVKKTTREETAKQGGS